MEAISFVLLDDGRLAIRCTLTGEVYVEDDSELHAVVAPLIAPLLRRHKAHLVALQADAYRSTAPFSMKLSSRHPLAARS